jgi:signal transduction histidine kinase/CheY-like chemotaxis protein
MGVMGLPTSLIIFFQNYKRLVNLTFAAYMFFISLWAIGLFFAFSGTDYANVLFWSRFLNQSAILIGCFFLHFTYVFTNQNKEGRPIIIFSYAVSFVYLFLTIIFPQNFIKDVIPKMSFFLYPDAGSAYWFFPLLYCSTIGFGIKNLFGQFKNTTDSLKKIQLKYLIIAEVVGFLGGGTTFPLVFNIPISPVGTLGVMAFVLIFFLGVAKSRLMNITIKSAIAYNFLASLFLISIYTIGAVIYYCFLNGTLNPISYSLTILYWVVGTSFFNYLTSSLKGKLEEAFEIITLKRNFLDMISHELRTPLNYILGANDIILNKFNGIQSPNAFLSLKDEILGVLKATVKTGEQMVDRLHRMFLSSSLINNKDIILEEIDLIKFCYEIKFRADEMIKESAKPIKFSLKGILFLEDKVMSNKELLKRSVLELIDNAIRFSDSGNISLTAWKDKNSIQFIVKDSGIGIPKNKLHSIFGAFKQIDEGLSRKVQGLGLGLFIAEQSMKNLKGNISVTSELTKGSTFTLALPMKLEKEGVAVNLKYEQGYIQFLQQYEDHKIDIDIQRIRNELKGVKVLACDDDEFNLEFLRMIFQDLNCELVTGGKDAIIRANAKVFDIVLMDIQMPGMDGIEAMNKIKSITKNERTPIIAVTGQAQLEDRQRFINEGFSNYISKPFKENDLLMMVYHYAKVLNYNPV